MNTTKQTKYDVVVIGAGSGGLTAAVGFSKIGKQVLLIEREHLGGECTNSGCIPSKALLHHAKEYSQAKAIAGDSKAVDLYRQQAFAYVRGKISEVLEEETVESFAQLGIDVVMGEAEFTAPCYLKVNDTEYQFKTAIIATGSSPRMMDISGLQTEDALTNQNLFKLDDIPKRTLIIGAGPIGLEMGQALAMLGSQVTIATIDTEFAQQEDPLIRPILRQKFEELGITIELQAYIQKVENRVAIFDRKEESKVIESFSIPFDKTLIAIGRVPNLPAGLGVAKIEADERSIMVDGQYRTSNKYVYAVGDVAQKLKFTHTADDAARQVVTRVASRGWVRVNKKKPVPKVTYTLPEVAQVGLNWEQSIEKFGEDRLMRIEVPLNQNDRAKTDNNIDGVLIVIARRLNGIVLGAHLVGPSAGEIISIFTLAIDQRISLWKLRSLIYAYPTYSLLVKKAGDQFFARQIKDLKQDLIQTLKRHGPKVLALFFWLLLIYFFQNYRLENNLSYSDVLLDLVDFFTGSLWGPLIYISIYALRPLILFPATLLTALSGTLFGFWWGILYTVFGENASANFAYWIGRFFGKDMKLENSVLGNWIETLRAKPFGTVLFMRLFYFPFDLTNYGSGILKINWPSYFTATLIGIMPGAVTFVALGAALDLEEFSENGLSFDIFDPYFLTISVIIFVVSLVLSRFLKRWHTDK